MLTFRFCVEFRPENTIGKIRGEVIFSVVVLHILVFFPGYLFYTFKSSMVVAQAFFGGTKD